MIIKFINYLKNNNLKWIYKHKTANISIQNALSQNMFLAEWNEQRLEQTMQAFQLIWVNSRDFLQQYSK